jgi:diguanylate cyclase (GGDEF)-like protein
MVKNLKTSCELIANLMNGYLHPSRDLEATKKLLIDKSNVDQVVNDFERSFTFKRVPALLKALQHIFDVPLIGCFTQSQAIALHNGALLELEENHKESIEQLFPDARSLIVQHDCLIKDGYSCAKAFPGIAGILAKRSPSKGELCFFLGKNELSQQVNWAGEPCTVTEVLNGGERGIEPRGSFKAWAQKVSGCSEAWSSTEVELQDYMFNKLNALFSKEVKQQLQEQLEEQALHDSLTLLPNRRKLRNFIEEFMIDRRRSGYLALLLIDMDNFKNINDYFGHDVGDRFLIEVADRLRHSIRPQDLAVRLGGDEFVVVFTGLYQSLQDTTDIVKKLTEKILERLRVPLDCKDNVIASSPSIGITIFDPIKSEFNEVIKQADTAMYQAKALGKNCYRLFDSADQERINEELKCLFELREAIANLNIDVHYQAKWKDNKVVGAEALARWKRDGVSFEPPGKFIRLAEKNGLIKQLGMVVLEKVCMDIAKTPAKLKDKLHISVNVSSQQMLDELFIPELKKVIGKHAVEPKTIRLEITETLFIERFDKAVEVLNELRALGFTISIDDFGTGYSSFSWLKMLPIDEVKIDKSFIDNIVCSEKDLKLVSGMIDLFERLHLDVVVEGVEEEEQAVLLKSIGGKIFQGFFFSRPEPFTQIEAWQC